MSPHPLAPPFARSCRPPGPIVWVFLALACAVLPVDRPQAAPLSFEGTGVGANGPIHVFAGFAASGTTVTLTLTNDGARTASKAEVLSSFYFNIVTPTGQGTLTLTPMSAQGQAFQLLGNGAGGSDVAASWSVTPTSHFWRPPPQNTAPSDLFAFKNFDQGWQAKPFSASGNKPPPEFNYGLGTVGNSSLMSGPTSLSFNGNIVKGPVYPGGTKVTSGTTTVVYPGVPQTGSSTSQINLGIYSIGHDEDPTWRDPSLLTNVLVRTSGTFVFGSSIDFSSNPARLDDYVTAGMFGFGTEPDLVIHGVRHLPEPGTLSMLATCGCGAIGWAAWRRRRRRCT